MGYDSELKDLQAPISGSDTEKDDAKLESQGREEPTHGAAETSEGDEEGAPLEHVPTLGILKFRPPDDDAPR